MRQTPHTWTRTRTSFPAGMGTGCSTRTSGPLSTGPGRATAHARTPAQGGDEVTYLNAFLDARTAAMRTEEAHSDTSRVDTEQRVFLNAGNLNLDPPLKWKTYGDSYQILTLP